MSDFGLMLPVLRTEFREFCVTYFVLRDINDLFRMANIPKGVIHPNNIIKGERRLLVEEYYASLNWKNGKDVERFLNVLSFALVRAYSADAREQLQTILDKCGFTWEENRVRLKNTASQSKKTTVAKDELDRLQGELLELVKLAPQRRGYAFEKFLNELFLVFDLAPRGAFKLIGEQIDGSFQLGNDTYLVEAKWQEAATPQSDLLIFQGKVESKSRWARGLFISNSGFTPDGLTAFSRGRATNILGMSGQDLYFILNGEISMSDVILKKSRLAVETGDFYTPVFDIIRR